MGKDKAKATRFKSAGEADEELFVGFNAWSAGVSTYGVQTSYAIIAANWAVYGSADKILSNKLAVLSMIIIILFLGINLLCIGWVTKLYEDRCYYANDNKDRWKEEYDNRENLPAWPYTIFMERLGDFKHLLNIFAPVVAGVIFIVSLF